MTKVLIATFSQAGSTKLIADRIARGLLSFDWEITHFSITDNNLPELKEYDIIGIGTPTYFFRAPFIVKDFVQNLNARENKASFVFNLHGTHQGDCGNWIRRKLRTKGTRDLGYFKSFGKDYWHGYIKRGVMFSPDSPTEAELDSAEEFGKEIARRFTEKIIDIEPFDPPTPLVYKIERLLVARPIVKLICSKTFKVNSQCDNCGICIQKCPVNNISEVSKDKLVWESKCILCGSCVLSCPKDAITSILDSKVFAPSTVYNIKASKKKKIPFANVEHSGGVTRLI